MSYQGEERLEWVTVGRVVEVPEGGIKEFSKLVRVVVVHREGRFYGFDSVYPRMGGPLAEGSLVGSSICYPWHHYLFDLATGENVHPGNVYPADLARELPSLTVRPVREIGGRLEVALKVGAR